MIDSVIQILADMTPPPPLLAVGEPVEIDVDGMIAVWYGGDAADAQVENAVGMIGAVEYLNIGVFWMLEAGATPDALSEHEYRVRTTIRQIKRALHAHSTLAGYPAAGLINKSEFGQSNVEKFRDDGGTEFAMVKIPWIFETLDMDPELN